MGVRFTYLTTWTGRRHMQNVSGGSSLGAGNDAARCDKRLARCEAAFCLIVLLGFAAGCSTPHIDAARQGANGQPQTPASEPVEQPENNPNGPAQGAMPALTIAAVSAAERDRTLRFTVSLSRASGRVVTVAYATEDGTATAGLDFEPAQGTLSFAAGPVQARVIEVAVSDDAIDEADETFTVRLSDPRGTALATATGTILDDDRRAVVVAHGALNVPEGGSRSYEVVLGSQPTGPVRIRVARAPDLSVEPEELVFSPSDWARPQRVRVTAAHDEDAVADEPVRLVHAASGGDYEGAEASSQVTIVEDDVATLAVAGSRTTERAGRLTFDVTLSRASTAEVTVDYATGMVGDTAAAPVDYIVERGKLRFAAGSTSAQAIEVVVRDDALDEPDEQLTVTLSNARNAPLAGGADTVAATGTIEDDDELPVLTISPAGATEDDGELSFLVTLQPVSGRAVTVRYATADVTATAGMDYTRASGTLTFAPGADLTQSITVPVKDDALDEADEEAFTVTLSAAVNAGLTGAGRMARGTIMDDDERGVRVRPTALTLNEPRTAMPYAVVLTSEPTAAVTVQVEVPEGAAFSADPARLTFGAVVWAVAQSVTVTASADAVAGSTATIEHTVSGGDYGGEPASAVTVTISEQPTPEQPTPEPTPEPIPEPIPELPVPELDSLQVTGGGVMYPEFASDVKHYAVRCDDPSTLSVTARTPRTGVRLTLLRYDPNQNQVSMTGILEAQVSVSDDHDLAVELSDSHGTATYVVHCIPSGFPQIRVLTRADGASGGLLFATPDAEHMTIIDYNGVPRFHRSFAGWVFQGHPDGPLIDGKRVRYSVIGRHRSVDLLDADFQTIRSVSTVAPLTHMDAHDFKITESGNFLFIAYDKRDRSYVGYNDPQGDPYTGEEEVEDSVIQEVNAAGTQVFTWNSWDYVKLDPDCRRDGMTGDYAHLNALQLVDGDIVTSLPGCSQVVRIDRSSGTGALEWKLGGTAPTRNPATDYLAIVGDTVGHNEFCGQHQPTLTKDGTEETVLMYDNGNICQGTRKTEQAFTRIVEYDISAGDETTVKYQYRRPNGYHTPLAGGVTMLDNRNWLIAWGDRRGGTPLNFEKAVTISEVDPSSGTAVFELLMYQSDKTVTTYRVYHEDEADVDIPLNLP